MRLIRPELQRHPSLFVYRYSHVGCRFRTVAWMSLKLGGGKKGAVTVCASGGGAMAVKGDSHTWQTLRYVCSTRPVWRSQTELFSEWVLSASKNSGLLDMDDYVLQP